MRLRADAGCFAAQLARAARAAGIGFAIAANRLTTRWRALAGIAETDWHDAIDMHPAHVGVSGYARADWPAGTRLLIRRVRLAPEQVCADVRSHRRRTLHPEQPALPLDELTDADADAIYACIVHRDQPRRVHPWTRPPQSSTATGGALRQLPSANKQVNTAWMGGVLLAANIAAWCHQLTGVLGDDDAAIIAGHGVRGGKAMIATPAPPGKQPRLHTGPDQRSPRKSPENQLPRLLAESGQTAAWTRAAADSGIGS
ncbi:hypothetical protein [Mycobacterium sp.]|uniref:hypothetical protein n=1 Tax=Mycobacterium sp. TaxID=1785 RepID=UPI0031D522B2